MSAAQKSRVAEMLAQKYTGADIARELRMPVRTVYLIKAQIRREANPGSIETKACAQCGTPFERSYATSGAEWAERKYCGRKCAGMAFRFQPDEGPERHCKHCDTVLIRRANEHSSTWKTRQYCGRDCATKARSIRRKGQTKLCQECGETIERGPRECTRDWLGRRFCGQQCHADSRTVTPRRKVKALSDPLPLRIFAVYERIVAERGLVDWAEAAVLCGMAA